MLKRGQLPRDANAPPAKTNATTPAAPMFAGAPGANRREELKQRYTLAQYQPYADAVARLQPISDKLTESAKSVILLREEAERLRQAAEQAAAEFMDARAGLILNMITKADVAAEQQNAEAAQLRAQEALARLQEAEQIHAIVQRACAKAEEERRHQGQAAKAHLQPQIRREHEAAVRCVADAFRELSKALAAEQEIREAVQRGPVSELYSLAMAAEQEIREAVVASSTMSVSWPAEQPQDDQARVRDFIHTESFYGNELSWFIELDKFRYGEWINGFRQRGYSVD